MPPLEKSLFTCTLQPRLLTTDMENGMKNIQKRVQSIEDQLVKICAAAGRSREEITLMAVTKTQALEKIKEAFDCGLRCFGENRVQEAEKKYRDFPYPIDLHCIGHLQRNKAKRAAELFGWVQSLDSSRIIGALQQHCAELDKTVDVLLEYNSSGEEQKHGFKDSDELMGVIHNAANYPNLRFRGLMTIAPFTDEETPVRNAFRRTKKLFTTIQDSLNPPRFNVLSMGMSADYPIAIEEGSTLIRVGTAIFGPRSLA